MALAKSQRALNTHTRNEEMLAHHRKLQVSNNVLIIGGGVVGVELAGEIAAAFPQKSVTLAHRGDTLLNGYKAKAQGLVAQQLQKLGVKIEFNSSYRKDGEHYVNTQTGEATRADLVYEATGTLPNSEFLRDELADTLDTSGFVVVDDNLQVRGHDNLFALGDVATVGEPKLGYLAQQQGVYLAAVIESRMHGKKHKAYKRNPLIALIPTGPKSGVVQLPFAVTSLSLLVNMKQKDLFITKAYTGLDTTPDNTATIEPVHPASSQEPRAAES